MIFKRSDLFSISLRFFLVQGLSSFNVYCYTQGTKPFEWTFPDSVRGSLAVALRNDPISYSRAQSQLLSISQNAKACKFRS
jgi:hypothetical protein